ncbi:MAG TPA: hypothetical protein VJW75_03450, partial [Candidatus Eisenbacteria bacterium]|nr:hypothetical protein [Candidatus Eisenbacteria bacterium]
MKPAVPRLFAGFLVLAASLAAPASVVFGEESLAPYTETSSLLATTPSTDDGAIGAVFNPAQWGLMDRPEFSFFWSDANVRDDRLDNWGFAGGQGLGYSMRRTEVRTPGGPIRVIDYQVGAGFGSGAHY